jgi:hypothetical protein
MLDKIELTTQLVAQLHKDQQLTVDQAVQRWWFNFRTAGGLRLTEDGYYVFRALDVEHYKFNLPDRIAVSGSFLLTLDKKLTCPYFINSGKEKYIILYGSKEATMLTIYGDIEKFISSLSQH